ncbi:hypothetical protein HZB01_04485 [Candidatus Woesearchaeota archaeon]|nr:hypothetical protein [Candidatus Woesearchaeota archaeon]
MRMITLSIMVLLLLPFVAGELVIDGWYYPGDTLNVDNHLYVVGLTPSYYPSCAPSDDTCDCSNPFASACIPQNDIYLQDRAVFRGENTSFILKYGECAQDALSRFCFKGVRFDLQRGYGKLDRITQREIPQEYITVESLEGELEMERSISSSSPFIQEETTVSVTIKSVAEGTPTAILFVDKLPSNVAFVRGSSDITFSEGGVRWYRPSLAGDASFFYVIKPLGAGNANFAATLGYQYEGMKKNLTSSTIKLTPKAAMEITTTLSPTTVPIGKKSTYTLTLFNRHPKDAQNVIVRVVPSPSLLWPALGDGFLKTGSALEWRGYIDAGEKEELEIQFQTGRMGSWPISTTAIATYGNIEETQTNNATLIASLVPLTLTASFASSDATLDPGQESSLTIYFVNNEALVNDYKDMRITVAIPGSDTFRASFPSLTFFGKNSKVLLTKIPFKAPMANRTTAFTINISGTYKTSYDDSLNFTWYPSFNVVLPPTADNGTLEIVYANPARMNLTDAVVLKVSARNTGKVKLDHIELGEIIPPDAEVIGGTATGVIPSLNPGETVVAYQYKLRLLPSWKSPTITLYTSASYFTKQENTYSQIRLERNRTLTLSGVSNTTFTNATNQTPPVTIETNATPTPLETNAPETESAGGRVVDQIVDFLKRLFS